MILFYMASFLSTRLKKISGTQKRTAYLFGGDIFATRTDRAERGGSNLETKRKRLSIVFATLFATKQGVCRGECTEATADDYATGESCRRKT